MKKFTGNYTTEATKVLKNSDRVICRTTEDGTIYICNGFILCKMNPLEYAAIVQPFSLCEPGNWIIDNNGKRDYAELDPVKIFDEAVKAANGAGTLERCPLELDMGKKMACCYYNANKKFSAFFNAKFAASFRPGAPLRCPGPLSAAVAYDGDEPFAMMLPIKPREETSRAVLAYYNETAEQNAGDNAAQVDRLRDELTRAQNENAQQAAELEALRAKLAELEAQQAQPQQAAEAPQQAAQVDGKTAAEIIASRFADMAGVTTTIKGAQTAAPVIWLAGNTEEHAEAIKAAGGKWSNKKSAFYVRVA